MDAYGAFYRRVLLPVWEGGIRRRPTLARLRVLERNQWRARDAIRADQLEQLRRLVVHAGQHVPYYGELFATLGLDPRRVQQLRDLAIIPPLTEAIARERCADLVHRRTGAGYHHLPTSGENGKPPWSEQERDRECEVFQRAVELRGYGWAGHRPGTRTLYYSGGPDPLRGTRGIHGIKSRTGQLLRREQYVDCLQQDERSLKTVALAISRRKPEFLVGPGVATAILSRFVAEQGLRDWGPIKVICGAECLQPADREAIQGAFGDGVFEIYGGLGEMALLAAECEAHAGLHTMDDAHLVEVVVGERPARPGDIGEVLVTDLRNFGMPLLRYRNGDLAIIESDEPCPCGRGFGRLRKILGQQARASPPRKPGGDPGRKTFPEGESNSLRPRLAGSI